MRIISGPSELAALAPAALGMSLWRQITQADVDAFAAVTGDDQWIHTDAERAASGPFGTTVAHGLFTLSLLPAFGAEIYRVDGDAARVNYGYDRIRFPHPVRVGSRVRAHAHLDGVAMLPGGARATVTMTVEVDGVDKPACVATSLVQFSGGAA